MKILQMLNPMTAVEAGVDIEDEDITDDEHMGDVELEEAIDCVMTPLLLT